MTKAELDSIKILPLEDSWYRKVKEKLDGIAKPLDGLGKFEHLIAQIGAIEKTTKISIQKKAVLVMCADNGVVEEQVSQSGKEVTLAVAKAMGVNNSSVGKMAAVAGVDECLSNYKIPEAAKYLQEFVDDLSNWYVRRSRERFWAKGMEQDKINAYMTLYTALVTVAKAAAPMIPFMTEDIYQNLVRSNDANAPESIHLCDFPVVNKDHIDKKLEEDMEDVLDVSSENLALLKEEAQMIDSDTLIRYIRIFSDLTNQLKYATQKRVLLEVTLIKLCRPAMDQNKDALLDRIRAIEKQLEEGAWEAPVRERIVYASDAKEAGEPKPKPELPQALNEDVKAVAKDFRMIINEASPMLRTYLKKARLSAGEGNRLLIVLPDELSASAVATPEHKEEIQSLIEQKIGKKVEIDVRQMEAGRRFEDNFVDLENLINMEITVEDE